MSKKKREPYYIDPITIQEKFDNIDGKPSKSFATRLNEILFEKAITQESLAEKTGLSTGSISAYRNGDTEPKIAALNAIANFLNVSTDYLLGNSQVANLDPNMQGVSIYTGLSEKTIEIIKSFNNRNSAGNTEDCRAQYLDILNSLFEKGIITSIISAAENYALFTCTGKLNFSYTSDHTKSVSIDPKIISEWFLDMEVNKLTDKIKEIMMNDYAALYSDGVNKQPKNNIG